MSDIIQLLPDHIANQIAAGEVIQRPASVVKEMIENAIDAGASKIQVILKDAGKTLIQIRDNGVGMTERDAFMCFERHATSKLRTADDLFHLTTKGFRGEALASVASIAHVSVQTRKADTEIGFTIEIEGSKITKKEACVCPVGTSFEVKNLFYNVPARRNFLKSDTVEFKHVLDEFVRVALAHPEISFHLHHNDVEVYNLHAVVLRKRIVDLLGKNTNDKLVPIEESTDIVEIKGFVGKPEFAKKSRGEQFLFVNDRFFKDSYFSHALSKAFEGLIPPKTFPSFFLYLTIDPQKIDVNVHPTKTEIKFEEDRLIYAILLSSVRQALGKYNIAPTLDFNQETSFELPHEMKYQTAVEPIIRVNTNYNPFQTTSRPASSSISSGSSTFTKALKAEGFGTHTIVPSDWENFYSVEEEKAQNEEATLALETDDRPKDFLIRGKYIFTPTKSGLLVIDCQRANERISYDQLIQQFVSNPISSQQMLFPIEREFSHNEKSEWLANKVMLERLGFYGDFNELVFSITAVPAVLQEESIHDCFDLILESIAFQEVDKGEIAHVLVHAISAAIGRKKTTIPNSESAQFLVNELFQCTEHAFTPDGKKIIQTITLDEISQKF